MTNGPHSLGGFKGRGPKRHRMTSQKPSNASKVSCLILAIALVGIPIFTAIMVVVI